MLHAWLTYLTVDHIAIIILGSALGVLLGSLPGIGPIFVLTLFVPITAAIGTVPAMSFLLSSYVSAVFGGAITAILFEVPGHPGNIATLYDGPKLHSAGRGSETIVATGLSGTIGIIGAVLVLTFVSPIVATVGLKIGPAAFCMLAVLGLSLVAAVSKRKILQGIMLGAIGLALSTIGQDTITGSYRFTAGLTFIKANGIPFADVAVGIFGVGTAYRMIIHPQKTSMTSKPAEVLTRRKVIRRGLDGVKALALRWAMILRSTIVGIVIGVLPGLGITLSNISAYTLQERLESVHKHKSGPLTREPPFGEGNIAGPMVAESADSATLVAELIPALSLGLPGGVPAALILEALLLHGVGIGPLFFSAHRVLSWDFSIAMMLAGVAFCALGIIMAPLLAFGAKAPRYIVASSIIIAAASGAYSVDHSVWDIGIALISGGIGFGISELGLPLAPIAMGAILGPLVEENFDRAILIERATHTELFFTGLPLLLGIASVIVFIVPIFLRIAQTRKYDANTSYD